MVEIQPSGGALGGYVTGVDLRAPQSPELAATLRSAWLEHLVLVFPDQPLSKAEFSAFARTMGNPGHYPFVDGLDDYPEIIEVKKLEHERTNFGGIWHSDTVYLERPPMASMLIAREIPPVGGDTEFANMYLAWETLPADLKAQVEPLRAINRSDLADVSKTRADRIADRIADRVSDGHAPASQVFESEHPVVRTHPETGRKALFVNVAHTQRFAGWTEADSRPILDRLFAHQTRDELVWRLQWQVDMLTVWDNRCLLHNPINDYHGHRRVMHRITLDGDIPR
jgi:taurine dioxygenase